MPLPCVFYGSRSGRGKRGGTLNNFPLSSFCTTALILAVAALIRLFAIPKFAMSPGRLQMFLEEAVEMIDFIAHLLRRLAGLFQKACVGFVRGLVRVLCATGGFCVRHTRELIAWGAVIGVLLILSLLAPGAQEHEEINVAMRDAVLHDHNQISLFGWKDVNPALIAAVTVNVILLTSALLIRIFVVPRLSLVPGRFQLVLETIVRLLDSLAGVSERKEVKIPFIGAYVFAAGVYIFTGTLFELLGLQAVTTHGTSVTLPAPLSDINAAICMGCLSYLVILVGGTVRRGGKGLKAALKEFSLPISMSFRLFGALLSGLLVTDLVYHYASLRYGIPVIVGVIFTLLHAVVQTYVLTMLVGMYYREVTEEEEESESAAV